MTIQVEDTKNPVPLPVDNDLLAAFFNDLDWAYRGFVTWLTDINKTLIFGSPDKEDRQWEVEKCDLCRFIDNVSIPEIKGNYDFKRLVATHNSAHESADALLRSHASGQLEIGDYETFKRMAIRMNVYVDHLRHLSAFTIAHTDDLTGLLTRDVMDNYLQKELDRCKRTGRVFCLAIADLDHFKAVNDTHGHQAGDDVLIKVAELFALSVRSYDHVFRYGGEEFLLLLPEVDESHALEAMERMRKRVQSEPIATGHGKIPVTLSIGLIEYKEGRNAEQLIREADENLYAAKEAGRNQVVSGRKDKSLS